MRVDDLGSKECFTLMFGGTIMLTAVILVSLFVGHTITVRSNIPTPVNVATGSPQIDVHVPTQPVPEIKVSTAAPKIDVHVPVQPAPEIRVSTPPAVVHVIEKKDAPAAVVPEPVPAQTEPKKEPAPVPVSTHSSTQEPKSDLERLFEYAEKYVENYVKKQGLDPTTENRKWLSKWQSKVETAIHDGLGSEDDFLTRTVVDNRDCFDLNAPPERICEGCRMILHMRDARLQWPQAMKDATAKTETMQKTIAVLAAGPK